MTTRRKFLWMAAGAVTNAAASSSVAQGVATRNLPPQPRIKSSGLPFKAHFTDVAASAGLTYPIVYGGLQRKDYIIETVGCGIAFFDFDNDGWLDIFVPCGSRMENAPPDATNRLYKNNRDGTFTDVTQKSGLTRSGWACGVTIADYNNDGFEDIFMTYYGQNVLYRNNGDGTFTDVTKEAGLLYPGPTRWGSGCTFIDYDRDGHVDLFLATYVDLNLGKLPKPGENPFCNFKGVPVNCGPRGLALGATYLYRNQGDGTFIDVTTRSNIGKATKTYAMTAVAADLDNDGWTDLYVASDSTPSLLFHNRHDGTFTEEGAERGAALSDEGSEQAGMGIAVGDYDLDGNLDLFKTHFSDDTSILYRNDGTGNFTDVTSKSGIAVESRYISWGTGFADFDNNGLPDLAIVTGSVYPEIERRFAQYPLKTPRMIFRNLGNGRFEELIEEAGPGISTPHCSRGCAFGDFDNDGDVDMLIANLNETPSLLRNDVTGGGNWIKVLLVGTVSNRSAIGSRILARYGDRIQAQAVMAQSSFYSVSDRRIHFGIGNSQQVELEIHWTNGFVESLKGLPANHLVTVQEKHGVIKSERFGPPA